MFIATIAVVPVVSASLHPHGKGASSNSTNCSFPVECCSALEGESRVKPFDTLLLREGPLAGQVLLSATQLV